MSTDGERRMVGSVRGVATRMEDVAKPGFLLVWCGIHQVDLVMKRVFTALKSSVFLHEDNGRHILPQASKERY
jgi:hypothetical protein